MHKIILPFCKLFECSQCAFPKKELLRLPKQVRELIVTQLLRQLLEKETIVWLVNAYDFNAHVFYRLLNERVSTANVRV